MSKYSIRKFYDDTLMKVQDILTDGLTNNLEIEKICYKIFDKDFLICGSSDQMPKYIKEEQCFILNTESSKSKGIHWCAFYKRNKKLYGYDSFNRNINSLSPYWKHKKIISANRDRDQSFKESSCGSRAISWIICFRKYGDKVIDAI